MKRISLTDVFGLLELNRSASLNRQSTTRSVGNASPPVPMAGMATEPSFSSSALFKTFLKNFRRTCEMAEANVLTIQNIM